LPESELNKRLETAVKAALAGGRYLAESLGEHHAIDFKGEVNLVTEADRRSEQMIYDIIRAAFPDDQFLAEEGTSSKGDSGVVWIVDPLDGTTNFAHGLPHFCVSIAVAMDDEPKAACIFNPNLNECFTAIEGRGAFLNQKRIRVSKTAALGDSLLATGFPYDIRRTDDDNMANFVRFYKSSQGVRRAGSAALDLAYVACGRFDGFWEHKLSAWDIAAGMLLVSEAGGRISDFDGDRAGIFKGEILASNGLLHPEMLAILKLRRQF